jgi:hypothetical protein
MYAVAASSPLVGSTDGVADAQSAAHTTKSPAATVPVHTISVETLAVMLVGLMAIMVVALLPACRVSVMPDCSTESLPPLAR